MFGKGDKSADDATYGFIDTTGKVVIKPRFDVNYTEDSGVLREARAFSDGLALVTSDHGASWGYIDRTGDLVVEPRELLAAWPFRDGLALVMYGDPFEFDEWRHAYIDKSGNTVWEEGKL